METTVNILPLKNPEIEPVVEFMRDWHVDVLNSMVLHAKDNLEAFGLEQFTLDIEITLNETVLIIEYQLGYRRAGAVKPELTYAPIPKEQRTAMVMFDEHILSITPDSAAVLSIVTTLYNLFKFTYTEILTILATEQILYGIKKVGN